MNIVKRHNDVRDHLEKLLPPDVTYYKEQRFGNVQPDFVIRQTPMKKIKADVKVTIEDPVTINKVHLENKSKNEEFRAHFSLTGKPAVTTSLIFGSLGSTSMRCKYDLHRIFRPKESCFNNQTHIRHDCPPLKKPSYGPYHRNSTNFLRIPLSS